MKKMIRGCVAALCMSLLVGAQTVLTSQWRTGAAPKEQRWWYTPDGYAVSGDKEINQTEEGVADMIAITVKAGNTSYPAYLYDNESSRALVSRFPMTISMGELNGNEKYYYLPQDLPTNTEAIGNIHSGDLMLFGSDCLVLFYEDFRTSYRYTKLGYLEDPSGLAAALGRGNVNVTFETR
ncbi:MAG: cyclophilin-like fold protein [Eubacteriales bacterium]|nr:cyclophilin-like fold protein [Eubacteriales bacterium]